MKYLFLLLLCNCFLNISAQYQIGHSTITYIDASRSNRSIATEIYYPALATGNNTTAASGQFPVIVFGHGFAMAWSAYHIPMYNALASSCKAFVNILGGGHCYFAQTDFFCDFGESGTIGGVTITRLQQQQTTYALLDNWLDYYLRNNCAGKDQFMTDIQTLPGITGQTTCSENVLPVISENSGTLVSSVSGTSYQWYYEGNPINNSNSISILPTLTGNYTVEVTYADACARLSAIYFYQIVGLEEFSANYSISPNPTNGIISIKTNSSEILIVQIYDISGKMISTLSATDEIDISYLKNGLYYLSINGIKYRLIKN